MSYEQQRIPSSISPLEGEIFRRWYLATRAEWQNEVQGDFPILGDTKSVAIRIKLELLRSIPIDQRATMALVVKKHPQTWLPTIAGEVLTEDEARFLEEFDRRGRRLFAKYSSILLQGSAVGPDRRKLRSAVLTELTAQVGKPDFSRSGRNTPVFWSQLGRGWILETNVDFGGNTRQVEYDFAIRSAETNQRVVEGLSWLGMGEKKWDCLAAGEEDKAARVIGVSVSRFLTYLPGLIDGLSPTTTTLH